MHTIAVITICYNNLEELKLTCESVDSQILLPEAHWVIDGSTSNDIGEWLGNNAQPQYRKWMTEKDKGISDAFNKGIQKSNSTILHLLNSGDRYFRNDSISIVKSTFEKHSEIKWTHSLYVQQRGGIDVVTGAPFQKQLLWKGMRTVAHPTMFVKKELYLKYGLFNLDYKIAMDYDFLVRIRNERFIFIDQPLVYFSPGGTSNTQFHRGLAEVRRSYQTHIGKSIKLVAWQLRQEALHQFMQTRLGKTWFKLKNRKKVTGLTQRDK
jgi:glycosyltransferase involved in cell wall biosynthesis